LAGTQTNPVSIQRSLRIQSVPVFIRKVAKPADWSKARQLNDASLVADYLRDPTGQVSLWRVNNDLELRRVAIALNEGRDSLHERLLLLPILPAELESVGIDYMQNEGATECRAVVDLHYEAAIDDAKRQNLLTCLLQKERDLGRCTESEMKTVEQISIDEGCFAAVHDSSLCGCGATR